MAALALLVFLETGLKESVWQEVSSKLDTALTKLGLVYSCYM